MKTLKLTSAVDGTEIIIDPHDVQSVREYPASQTWIQLKNGFVLQPTESVETVNHLLEELTG